MKNTTEAKRRAISRIQKAIATLSNVTDWLDLELIEDGRMEFNDSMNSMGDLIGSIRASDNTLQEEQE